MHNVRLGSLQPFCVHRSSRCNLKTFEAVRRASGDAASQPSTASAPPPKLPQTRKNRISTHENSCLQSQLRQTALPPHSSESKVSCNLGKRLGLIGLRDICAMGRELGLNRAWIASKPYFSMRTSFHTPEHPRSQKSRNWDVRVFSFEATG